MAKWQLKGAGLLVVTAVLFVVAMAWLPVVAAPPDRTYESEGMKFRIENLVNQRDVIWGFDFLADGRIIFTEREGAIRIFDPATRNVVNVSGAPSVWSNGQGGLLDIRVHPTERTKIYITYSEPVGGGATTALASATLSGTELKQFKKLLSAGDANSNGIHFGSRIEFDGRGHVFFTVGDRNNRPTVQNVGKLLGKIIRLKEDGTVPSDNPFVGRPGAKPEIWSLGHRSPQGLVRHPVTGDLWMSEMGPLGGDEVNLVKKGLNYGWPVITYGREYSGGPIGEGTHKAGMEQPVAYWVPSISPSAMTIYNGEAFPGWKGHAFLGNLSGSHLRLLILDGHRIVRQEPLLRDLNMRVRNVRPGPDGFLYLSTDGGKIARLVPVK
jgi:glucose/arabinose dehydrogenase